MKRSTLNAQPSTLNENERAWTAAQRAGIESVGRSLLVSAAAGSGKTSVLAERCAHLVCDVSERCDVDELLVVTFTEAAAAEMRDRIHKALVARQSKQPSEHLARQIAVLDRAAIGTLHSFCARLLRQHFHLLGLDPDFLILDADEAELMKLEVARTMFADYYDMDGDASAAFRKLIDCYGDGNDERLVRQVIRAHDTLCSVVDPTAWLNNARRRIAQAIELPLLHETELGREYARTIRRHLEAMRAQCGDAGKAVKQLKYFPFYVDDLRGLYKTINHWIKVLDSHGMEGLVEEAETVELPRLQAVSNDVPGKEAAKSRVDEVRDAVKNGPWRQCLRFSSEQWKDGLKRTQPHVEAFLSLVEEFSARYAAAKQEDGGLDFADLERHALGVLREPAEAGGGGLAPSPVARLYHRQFKHVLVDEYQDINEVQDAILTLVSRECLFDLPRDTGLRPVRDASGLDKPGSSDVQRSTHGPEARVTGDAVNRGVLPNLFCVGDVKQSIYRFRLAEPARFLQRRRKYNSSEGHGQVIDLQENFRSREPLLDAINAVFERLMTAEAADLNYDESQKLRRGADYPAALDGAPAFKGSPIEMHLLPKDPNVGNGGSEDDGDDGSGDDDTGPFELDRTEREASLLAQRIFELTGKFGGQPAARVFDRGTETYRPIRFGDIVILLRSMRFKADQFAEVLRRAGIPVHSQSATGYFEATEVNDVLSLLKVLDNGRQDIPLTAVLRSPLVALPQPEQQLARIRLACPGDPPPPFHEAVRRYAAEHDDDLANRLRAFLAQLNDWRRRSRQRPLAEVIWTIYDQTGYLAFCCGLPRGEQRQANLLELHARARQFGTFRRQGLSRFLEFLQKLKNESDLGQASIASEAEDVVRIMSIHRSKGLEFPVVMLPDLGKAFNLRDCGGSILLDRQAGIGMQVVDEQRQIRYPSLAWSVVQQRLRQQSLAEELRVLYVAMTRAKEHLILVGTARAGSFAKWTTQWQNHDGSLPAESVLGARSMLDWLGPVAAICSASIFSTFEVREHSDEEVAAWSAVAGATSVVSPTRAAMAELKPLDPPPGIAAAANEVIERVSARYRFEDFTTLRAASGFSPSPGTPGESGGEFGALAALEKQNHPHPDPLPEYRARGPEEARRAATRVVLRHLDFKDTVDAAAIRRQIDAMVKRNLLPPTDAAAAVDVESIQWLMSTEIGRLLRDNAARIVRHLPIHLGESRLASGDALDQVMVRGRIDVLVPVNDDEFLIIDFAISGAITDGDAAQLRVYRNAVERIMGKRVSRSVLVLFERRELRDVDA
jgi:ATP-dependent helicase/nuclease subunit A